MPVDDSMHAGGVDAHSCPAGSSADVEVLTWSQLTRLPVMSLKKTLAKMSYMYSVCQCIMVPKDAVLLLQMCK